MKFYICKGCGNIVAYLSKTGCNVKCCGQEMVELVPKTTDAAGEKHVPVVTCEGKKVCVKVGSVAHPMLQEHSIQWIALESKKGMQRKQLAPGEKPEACFILTEDDEPVAAYEYCNLHGLWKTEI